MHPHIIDGSALTFRQNAEATKYCTLLVGCSSGISWLATSDWAKPLPQIQLLSGRTRMFASMFHDAKYFNLPTDNFIELVDVAPQEVAEIVLLSVRDGCAKTFSRYQTAIPVKFDFYFSQIYNELISKRQYGKTSKALSTAFTRYQYDDNGKIRPAISSVTYSLLIYVYYGEIWRMKTEEHLLPLDAGNQGVYTGGQ